MLTVSQHACNGYTIDRTEDALADVLLDPEGRSCAARVTFVFDGHRGGAVAHFAAGLAPDITMRLFSTGDSGSNAAVAEHALPRVIEALHSAVEANSAILGGATCNATYIDERGCLVAACLGDSQTFVFRRDEGAAQPHQSPQFRCVFETTAQDCNDETEAKRLRALGLPVIEQMSRDASGNFVPSGVFRCLGMMCMAALGDYDLDRPRGAVNRVPVVSSTQLEEGDVVVQCSDGCIESVARANRMNIQSRPDIRIPEIARSLDELVCAQCSRLRVAGSAEHITERQVDSMLLMRGTTDRSVIYRAFDNQTVHVTHFGSPCAC
jgi:serine/threonine protein phosphatase PrpC